MAITGMDHFQLAMPAGGEPLARKFYQGLLEIPEVPKPPELAKRGGVWFENGGVKLHLGVDPEFRAAKKAHPGLVATNLDLLTERLRNAGYEVVSDEQLDRKRCYVNDPFGNRLELISSE